jgi:tRNA (adenine37-N6)-methyltransferase
MTNQYSVQAIGTAVTKYKEFTDHCDYQNDVSEIVINDEYADGLMGTELFSNLFCIYYQHRQDNWKQFAGYKADEPVMKLPLTREPTCRGVFSKRSPARPAKLGSCVVTLLRREGKRLIVKGLDALDGSPVIDLKPYVPQFDAFPLATAPLHWCVSQTSMLHSSRSIHWDTVNVTFALGCRAGMKALRLLAISRNEAHEAKITGAAFFAHGVEAVTGCSIINGAVDFTETEAEGEEWTVILFANNRKAKIIIRDGMYSGADEVFSLDDETLFENWTLV